LSGEGAVSGELRELYQQVILDHHRRPRNFGGLEGADRHADGYNPLCGDRIRVELRLGEDGHIEQAAFTGSACAICTASASLMTESVRARPAGELEDALGKLVVFAGVREFPIRVKCATLPWHVLRAALEGSGQPVSTE
jgi:nitrogen fixation NifU-like protein